MKLEQQVINLEIAKKLKQLNVKQESLYYWEKDCSESDSRNMTSKQLEWCLSAEAWHDSLTGEWGNCHELKDTEHYSAFTVAELGDMLPQHTSTTRGAKKWSCRWWTGSVMRTEVATKGFVNESDTEAEARGKMLIYLLENKLITL